MQYFSTRQKSKKLNFIDTVLEGLASDGGLYLPESLPSFSATEIDEMRNLSYQDLMFRIVIEFTNDEIDSADLKEIIAKSYKTFFDSAITPLKKLNEDEYLLELFHGPTFAFKDLALQFLGNLFQYILEKRNEKIAIIGATSGDTGSAAIYGCKACENADIFILHPHNLVSDIQRKQMVTISDSNVFNIALKGNFDDCQSMVKKMFMDQSFLKGRRMVAVNSINWVRIMAQIVYYFYAFLKLDTQGRAVSFSVPTGNFGDVYAGYLAKKMGLKINKLIVATNSNDILCRFINDNDYSKSQMVETLSPSMNIQVSSNFERLLFNLHNNAGQPEKVGELMSRFEKTGKLSVSAAILEKIKTDFASYSGNDAETCQVIADVLAKTDEIIDPHTAIGIVAINKHRESCQNDANDIFVNLATAHPAKFPDSIKKAGVDGLQNPAAFASILQKQEFFTVQENDLEIVKNFIGSKILS